jgi:hypothetical protein
MPASTNCLKFELVVVNDDGLAMIESERTSQ